MHKRIIRWAIIFGVLMPCVWSVGAAAPLHRSVVKIYVTQQRSDYTLPWQPGTPGSGTGSGFIVAGRRILTNAHIVSDARFLQVQKEDSAERYEAFVRFVGHDCDLALIEVRDPAFFNGTIPLAFAKTLPDLTDEVVVLGYPMGGSRLSITKGVVSRIDYNTYSHSDVDQHLVLQVDAAINPGNSGGPVLFNGRVVGLAFQGLSRADNIGYAIPLPVIERFLRDVDDNDTYDGYPELGIAFMPLQNPAMRRDLRLEDGQTGIVIYHVDPYGNAVGHLRERDVLLTIDGYPIDDDGTIRLERKAVLFAELLERKQSGESVAFRLLRDGKVEYVNVPLRTINDPFMYRNLYDEIPRYFVTAGLVFAPLNRPYLGSLRTNPADTAAQQLVYYAQFAKIDSLIGPRREFVVLIRRLPHTVNTYADDFINGIVTTINDMPIVELRDVEAAFEKPVNGFHVLRFAGKDETLVLDAREALRANAEISVNYSLPAQRYYGEPE